MSKPAANAGVGTFFSASEAREERWRELHRAAKALAAGDTRADKRAGSRRAARPARARSRSCAAIPARG